MHLPISFPTALNKLNSILTNNETLKVPFVLKLTFRYLPANGYRHTISIIPLGRAKPFHQMSLLTGDSWCPIQISRCLIVI